LEGGFVFVHYVEIIRVGVLMSVRPFVWAAILFFRFLFSKLSDFSKLHN